MIPFSGREYCLCQHRYFVAGKQYGFPVAWADDSCTLRCVLPYLCGIMIYKSDTILSSNHVKFSEVLHGDK